MNVRNRFKILADKIKDVYPKLWELKDPSDNKERIHRMLISDIQQRFAEIYAALVGEAADDKLDLTYAEAMAAYPEHLLSVLNLISVLSLAIKTKLQINVVENVMNVRMLADINMVALECYKINLTLSETANPNANSLFEKGITHEMEYTDYVTGVTKRLRPGLISGQVFGMFICTSEQQIAYHSTLVRTREYLDQHYNVIHIGDRVVDMGQNSPTELVEVRQPKSLSQLAANVISKNHSILFKDLGRLSARDKEKFPELDLDYKKRLVTNISKTLAGITFSPSEKEQLFLDKFSAALLADNPYNATHMVIQSLDQALKGGFLSVFKTNMMPVRNKIVRLLQQYCEDKKEYVDHFGKGM